MAELTDAGKLRLREVQLEGFRGVNRPVTLSCGDATTLLLAPNGQGKTSVLGGIEWCLFGKLNFQPSENKTNDELVNLQHPRSSTKVELILEGDGTQYVVRRERRIRKRETDLTVQVSGGERIEGLDAEDYLFRLLGLTWEDFSRAVFLHQESIRGLLIDRPEVRDSALDRLFGLEKLRDVSRAIPLRVVTDAIEAARHRSETATSKIEGAAEQVENDRQKYLVEAKEAGFTEKDLTLENGLAIASRVNAQLDSVARENAFDLPSVEEAAELNDLERVCRRAKEATKLIRIAVAKTAPAGETAKRITQMDVLGEDLEISETGLTDATEALKNHEKEWGNQSKLIARKADVTAEMEKLEHKLNLLGVQDRLLSSAIEYLHVEPHARNCPVCAQSINPAKLAVELELQVRSAHAKEGKALNEAIRKSRQLLDTLEQALTDSIRLTKELDRAKRDLSEAIEAVTALLPVATDLLKAKAAIKAALKSHHAQLDEQNRAHSRREEKLQQIDGTVDSLRVLDRFLKTEAKFVQISTKTSKPEEEDPLHQELGSLLRLQESLEAIGLAINEVAKSRAVKAVEESRDDVAGFYKQLCNHPYFDQLRIETDERNVQGIIRNTYAIRATASDDRKETLASSRLSTGQMNCVAISIYLALARILSHRIGFVILDDPSQNLDTEHKVALAKVLKKLQSATQLLIATEDSELQTILKDQLDGAGTVTYKLSWQPKNGTTLVPG